MPVTRARTRHGPNLGPVTSQEPESSGTATGASTVPAPATTTGSAMDEERIQHAEQAIKKLTTT
ncbi:MAG: hypothetical protein M1837_003979, partial [Sclerophora amabilis]